MKKAIQIFFEDESGLTTVEYAVAGALISLAVVGAFGALGANVSRVTSSFNKILSTWMLLTTSPLAILSPVTPSSAILALLTAPS